MFTEFPRRRILALWALAALLMVAASYFVVLVIAAVCVYLPYLLLTTEQPVGFQTVVLGLCGFVIAGTMLWSLIPRRDNFKEPGPTLDKFSHPKLFAELEYIASALDEPLPDEVFLIPQANAFVADRGGIMGVGSRRVMGIGLPLIAIMSLTEFRAILAHEFAHYYGGDTRLGPWVYKTRMAMVRAIQNMASVGSWIRIALAQLVFRLVLALLQGYWKIFFRATQLVSRRQEYRADELACYITAADALVSGLKKVHAANVAFGAYWGFEVTPLLNLGYRPPIAEGFAMFVQAPEVAMQIEKLAQKELSEPKTSAYDSHPPLRDRISAATRLSIGKQESTPGFAADLFGDLREEELRLLSWNNDSSKIKVLKPLDWQNLASALPQIWQDVILKSSQFLGEHTTESLPDVVSNLAEIGSRIPDPEGMLLTPQQRAGRAEEVFGTALALALANAGWRLHMQPGERYFEVKGEKVSARELMSGLVSKKISRDEWIERCHQLKISGARLAGPRTDSAANETV
jgi:heat shock protein HtpX